MIILAYVVSVGVGWLLATVAMQIMYRSIGQPRLVFRWLYLWVGGTERAIATTLVIWTPKYLPAFIGGWIILKVAAHWGRSEGPEFGERHLAALVGSAISFSTAIAAGLLANPAALAVWQNISN